MLAAQKIIERIIVKREGCIILKKAYEDFNLGFQNPCKNTQGFGGFFFARFSADFKGYFGKMLGL